MDTDVIMMLDRDVNSTTCIEYLVFRDCPIVYDLHSSISIAVSVGRVLYAICRLFSVHQSIILLFRNFV